MSLLKKIITVFFIFCLVVLMSTLYYEDKTGDQLIPSTDDIAHFAVVYAVAMLIKPIADDLKDRLVEKVTAQLDETELKRGQNHEARLQAEKEKTIIAQQTPHVQSTEPTNQANAVIVKKPIQAVPTAEPDRRKVITKRKIGSVCNKKKCTYQIEYIETTCYKWTSSCNVTGKNIGTETELLSQ